MGISLEHRIIELENAASWYEKYHKIQTCPVCNHYTFQYYSSSGFWVCLTCGSELEKDMVLKRK